MATKSKSRPKANGKALIVLHLSKDIPLNKIRLSDANVRSIFDQAEIDSLAESIAHRGLLQSLNVRSVLDGDGNDTGEYEVPAGGRRYRALQVLVKQKRLAADTLVPCIVKTGGMAEDDSLAENSDRADLHPLDEYRAFAAMKAKGASDDDIAAAYRVTPAFVRQRLRLAAASPVLLEAYANDELSLQLLMAYCVTDDQNRQEAVYNSIISGGSHNHYVWNVKQKLTEQTVAAVDQRAVFVGLEPYEAAGGAIMRDLFDDDNEGYLQDPELLNRLVHEKLATIREEHLAKGWKWAEAALSISYDHKHGMERLLPINIELTAKEEKRIIALEAEQEAIQTGEGVLTDEEEQRLEAIEAELNAIQNKPPVFKAEDMARAGVFISVDHDGALSIAYGFIQPEDVLPTDGAEEGDSDEDCTTFERAADDEETGEEPESPDEDTAPGKPIPDRLMQDLTAFRTVAMRNAMAQDFKTAFVTVLHSLALSHFYHRTAFSCLQLEVRNGYPVDAPGLDTWGAAKAIDARDAEWRKILPKEARDVWKALWDLDANTRNKLFAHCASFTINAVKQPHMQRRDELRHADSLAMALGLHMVAAGWTTNASNYLGRVTKGHILEAVREAKGDDSASLIEHLKKDQMATEAERLLQGTGWLPVALRLPADRTVAPAEDNADGTALPAFLTDATEGVPAAA